MNTVEQIKDRLSIEEVVGRYVALKSAGSNLKGLCPFHSEKTPSFVVSPTRQTYHCFGCGAGGDIFSFVQAVEGLDFKGALKVLAEQAGVEIVFEAGAQEKKDERDRLFAVLEEATHFFVGRLEQHAAARNYLNERGLHNETVSSFRIGFAPDSWGALHEHLLTKGFTDTEIATAGLSIKGEKGYYDRFRSRIMFPIADSAGRIVAFSGRIFGENTKEAAKYVNSPETPLYNKSRILYGFDRAKQSIRKNNFVILVEGQMDLVATHQAHYANTVALSGTALTPEHITLLSRMSKNLLIALDADNAGVASAEKSAHAALRAGFDVKVATLPAGKDPADVLLEEGEDAWRNVIKQAQHIIQFALGVEERAAKDARAFKQGVSKHVLPFVLDVESAIDREHFVKEISACLGVSEEAIYADLETVASILSHEHTHTEKATQTETIAFGSVREILARIVLWQESLAEQAWIDAHDLKEKMAAVLGAEESEKMIELAKSDTHAAFVLENLYTDNADLERAVENYLLRLEHAELERAVQEETQKMKRAEYEGNTGAIEEAQARITELISKKARLAEE